MSHAADAPCRPREWASAMKVRLFFGTAALVLLAGFAALWVQMISRPGISPQCYQRIQEGMNQAQVEAILGGPPRCEVQAKNPADDIIYGFRKNVHWPAEWWGRAGVITVFYDNKGIVYKKIFEKLPYEPKPRSFWDWFP